VCFYGQVSNALNWAATNTSLPVHFYTDDDALTEAGEPSYTNVRAVLAVVPGKCEYLDASHSTQIESIHDAKKGMPAENYTEVTGNTGLRTYTYEFDAQLLAAYASDTVAMINDNTSGNKAFVAFLNTALADAGLEDMAAVAASATLST